MTINNFFMTKDQYDHIRHILISTPKGEWKNLHVTRACIYLYTLTKTERYKVYPNSTDSSRILTLKETFNIVKKIESKL